MTSYRNVQEISAGEIVDEMIQLAVKSMNMVTLDHNPTPEATRYRVLKGELDRRDELYGEHVRDAQNRSRPYGQPARGKFGEGGGREF